MVLRYGGSSVLTADARGADPASRSWRRLGRCSAVVALERHLRRCWWSRGVKEYLLAAALHDAGRGAAPSSPIMRRSCDRGHASTRAWRVATHLDRSVVLARRRSRRVQARPRLGSASDRHRDLGPCHAPAHPRLEPGVDADSRAPVMLDDETLRDGLQSPSVRCPTIDEKMRILHLIDRLGIDTADIGLPGAGPHVVRDVERLAREIRRAAAAASRRTAPRGRSIADIKPIARDLAARRHPDRVLRVHRLEPAPAVRRRLDASTSCCS